MLSPRLSDGAASAAADAVCARLNNGYLRIFAGSQPADANTALGSQVLLAELRFGVMAFASAVAGVAAANAITPATSAAATGTASFFRTFEADGSSVVFDGSVGTSQSNLVLNSVAISAGAAVSVSAFEYVQAKQG